MQAGKYTSLSPKGVRKALSVILTANKVCMIHGNPGLGKTAMINQVANDNGLQVVLISGTQNEPGDINGLVDIFRAHDEQGNRKPVSDRAQYTPFDLFPLEDSVLPEGKRGWLIFLDELPSACPEMQSAMLKLVHERLVGNRKLHPLAYIVAAGNYVTDRAASNKLISSMATRLTHLHMAANHEEWLEYEQSRGGDWRVMAYIQEYPQDLLVFDPSKDTDFTSRCPRTWSDLSDILNHIEHIEHAHKPIIEGTIGVSGAAKFMTFAKMASSLPRRADIIADPDSIEVPGDDLPVAYMLAFLLVEITRTEHYTKYLGLFRKFSKEFQFLILRAWCTQKGQLASAIEIQTNPDLDDWIQDVIRLKQC